MTSIGSSKRGLAAVALALAVSLVGAAGCSDDDGPELKPNSSSTRAGQTTTDSSGSPTTGSGTTDPTDDTTTPPTETTDDTSEPEETTTTLSPEEVPAAIRAFLAGEGAPLMAFEQRADDRFAGEIRPNRKACQDELNQLANTLPSNEELRKLAQKIPDLLTSNMFVTAMSARWGVLYFCISPEPFPPNVASYAVRMRQLLVDRLKTYGVTL